MRSLDITQDHCEARAGRDYERVTICTPWGSAYLTRACVDLCPGLLIGMVVKVLELELAA